MEQFNKNLFPKQRSPEGGGNWEKTAHLNLVGESGELGEGPDLFEGRKEKVYGIYI
ncbi:MAG: hypothetical protein Q4E76_06465 [Tissierellia bacterium]|nr:hypothetical protein [Tissierellia bacterium]